MTTPILEAPRLILRPSVFEDHVWVQQLFPHWDIVKHMNASVPWPYPADGARQYYEHVFMPDIASGKSLGWAVTEKASGVPMGVLQLTPKSDTDNRGFWLGSSFHNKGFMSEAVVVTTDYAFGPLGMKRLLLNNAKDNAASGNIKLKANATLLEERESDYVCGKAIQQHWELRPDAWATSPMKQASLR